MLPTEKRKARKHLEDFNILLYGAPKLGKSTFASKFSNPLFISTESGLNALEVFESPTPTWKSFLSTCNDLSTKKHHFNTIVIDTIDNLYKSCVEYVRARNNIEHESDLGYGKGYSLVKDEFMSALRMLSLLKPGMLMISHATFLEVKTRTSSYHKAVPTLPQSIRDQFLGWVDIIMYADITPDGERVLNIKPDDKYISGDRTASLYGSFNAPLPLEYAEFSKSFYNRK
jgi:hypothetical protein